MEVVLLGTGAADGWPNPFCDCASCTWMRRHGEVRGQSAALVDDVLLLDCGPEVPRAALRHDRSLAGVRHLLLTHAHPDHVGGAALMWRGWAGRDEPLDVVGPPAVLAECRRWVDATAPLRWHEVRGGDRLAVGGYDVRALPAHHGDDRVGPAVLYDVTGPDGVRVLWAQDTDRAPRPDDGAVFDAVFLEETDGDADAATPPAGTEHLDLRRFGLAVAQLRRCGAVTDATRVVAVHCGHRNPPADELRRRLAAWGAQAPPDGTTLHLGKGGPAGSGRQPRRPARVLVVGGARSGKSREAERRLLAEPEVTYVATGLPRTDDAEWQGRVAEHRSRRPAHWTTVETLDLAGVLRRADGPVLVDCLTLWLAAVMDEPDVDARVDALVAAWAGAPGPVVAVSNEVGSGVVPEHPSGRRFRDLLGSLNARLAAAADEVWLLTAGLATPLKADH